MKSLAWIALALLLAMGAAILVPRRSGPPETQFDGKSVVVWARELNGPSASVRSQAEEFFQRLDPVAVPPLIRLLRTPDPILAKPLRKGGRHLPSKIHGMLCRVINPSEAPFQRTCAALALRTMGTNAGAALPALRAALMDDQPISWQAALALAQMGPPGTEALTSMLPRVPPIQAGFICHALKTQGPAATNAIPALIRVLTNAPLPVVEKAALALASMGQSGVPGLIQGLAHPDSRVRVLVANVLAGIGPLARAALPELARMAKADQPGERQAAVTALGQIRPTAEIVVTTLTAALKDPARQVRLKAVEEFHRAPPASPEAAAALIQGLRDESAEVRGQVAALLGEMGSSKDQIVPALRERLTDENELVRTRARQALEKLEARNPGPRTG